MSAYKSTRKRHSLNRIPEKRPGFEWTPTETDHFQFVFTAGALVRKLVYFASDTCRSKHKFTRSMGPFRVDLRHDSLLLFA